MAIKSPTRPAELFWLDAQCPDCKALGGIRYAPGRRPDPTPDVPRPATPDRRVRCNICGWQVSGILPKVHDDLMWARTLGESVDAILLVLATQAAPVADAPPLVVPEKGAPGTHKNRIIPPKEATPAERLLLKAEQFRLNGGLLRKVGGYIRATSQRRDGDLRPVTEYPIARDGHTWRCGCEATGPCAHLAGLWLYYSEALADPDVALNEAQRAAYTLAVQQLAAQFGVRTATIGYATAADDLFGTHAPIIAHSSPNAAAVLREVA
jgi:hypothetical protein